MFKMFYIKPTNVTLITFKLLTYQVNMLTYHRHFIDDEVDTGILFRFKFTGKRHVYIVS